MTPAQLKQITLVKTRIANMREGGATNDQILTALRAEEWEEAAIQAAMEDE